MVTKRKKTSNDGPVKIVGVNHGLCLHLYLLLDGWKKEQFTDVTFICRSSQSGIGKTNDKKHDNKLFANRSVLAAASPFFADLLPENELELDICISVDLTFEEMFCVLEYVYSGKLLCSYQSKDSILSILKDFKIFVPGCTTQMSTGQSSVSSSGIPAVSSITAETTENIIQATQCGTAAISNSILESNTTVTNTSLRTLSKNSAETQVEKENNISAATPKPNVITVQRKSLTSSYRTLLPKPSSVNIEEITEHDPPSHLMDHSYEQSTSPSIVLVKPSSHLKKRRIETTSICPNQALFSSASKPDSDSSQKNLTLQHLPDREAVTMQLPSHFADNFPQSNERYLTPIKSTQRHKPGYTLRSYHVDTWCYGVFSPFEPEIRVSFTDSYYCNYTLAAATKRGTSSATDTSTFHQITSPVLRPQRVYSRSNATSQRQKQSNIAGLIIKKTDIQNMKAFNGKIHIVLKEQQPVEPVQENAEWSDDLNSHELTQSSIKLTEPILRPIRRKPIEKVSEEESNEDRIDYVLAKHFFKVECRRRKVLQNKFRRINRQLNQEKEIALSILKKVRDFEQGKCENYESKLPKVKKLCPKKQCNECGKIVAAKHLPKHLKIHSGIKSYLCDLCGRTFVLRSYLEAHKRSHHLGIERVKIFQCTFCEYTTHSKNKLEVHNRIHTNEKPFDCQFCDKKFREKGTLVRHLRTHTGERPYVCNICGASFAARDTFLGHCKRIHEKREGKLDVPARFGSRKIVRQCDYCDKTFFRVLAYEKHIATHTGVAPAILCPKDGCGFTYSTMAQLRDHTAVCHPERTYTCAVCSKVFLSKSNHDLHQAKHDTTLGFHCAYCPAIRTTKASLTLHETIHTRETPYECSYCKMRFYSVYLMNLHIRKEHEPRQPKKRIRNKKNKVNLTEV